MRDGVVKLRIESLALGPDGLEPFLAQDLRKAIVHQRHTGADRIVPRGKRTKRAFEVVEYREEFAKKRLHREAERRLGFQFPTAVHVLQLRERAEQFIFPGAKAAQFVRRLPAGLRRRRTRSRCRFSGRSGGRRRSLTLGRRVRRVMGFLLHESLPGASRSPTYERSATIRRYGIRTGPIRPITARDGPIATAMPTIEHD